MQGQQYNSEEKDNPTILKDEGLFHFHIINRKLFQMVQ